MKKLIFLFLAVNAFSKGIPYCAYEVTSQYEILRVIILMNDESQKVLQKENEIIQAQKKLINVLDNKIQILIKIKKILSALYIQEKKENFELKKQIDLIVY